MLTAVLLLVILSLRCLVFLRLRRLNRSGRVGAFGDLLCVGLWGLGSGLVWLQ